MRQGLTSGVVPSQPVGTIAGTSQVGAEGSAGYLIPLEAPKGRAGLEPNLALSYSSRGGNGIAGVGWSLSGLSSITRCGQRRARDGENLPVDFSATDRFCLDGARLVAVNGGAYGAHGTTYRTERDAQVEVVSYDPDALGPLRFVARTRDGRVQHFGSTIDSRVEAHQAGVGANGVQTLAARRRLHWLQSRVEDRAGNFLTVMYGQDANLLAPSSQIEYWPFRIDYTGAVGLSPNRSVTFEYESRIDHSAGWMRGIEMRSTRRLKSVTLSAPASAGQAATAVRKYALAYSDSASTKRSRLAALSVCDAAGVCLPATRFDYSAGEPVFDRLWVGYVLSGDPSSGGSRPKPTDVNGDGKDDLVYEDSVRLSYGFGWHDAQTLPAKVRAYPSDGGLAVWDIDGDGATDLLRLDGRLSSGAVDTYGQFLRLTGGTFAADAQWDTPKLYRAPRVTRYGDEYSPPLILQQMADLDGDMLGDHLALVDSSQWTVRFRRAGQVTTGNWDAGGVLADTAYDALGNWPDPARARVIDIDGDGQSDVLLPYHSGTTSMPIRVLKVRASRQVEVLPTNLTENHCNVYADINGDGLIDVINVKNGVMLRRNIGGGQFLGAYNAIHNESPPFTGISNCDALDSSGGPPVGTGVHVVDYDQDGRQDLLILGASSDGYPYLRVLLSRPDGMFLHTVNPSAPIPLGQTGAYLSKTLDVNGDGLFDILQWSGGYTELYVQREARADLLVTVTNGMGAQHGFAYKPLSSTGYQRGTGCTYPLNCWSGPMVVVGHETLENGVTHIHEYLDGRADLLGEGFLGFLKHRVRLDDHSVVNETTFNQKRLYETGAGRYPFRGLADETRVTVRDGATTFTKVTRNTWAERRLFGNTVWFAFPSSTTTDELEQLDGQPAATVRSQTSTTLVDDWANPLTVTVDRGDGFKTVTERTWENDGTRWLIGLLRDEKVTSVSPSGSVSHVSAHTYDARGLLTETVREPEPDQTALMLRVTLTRDARGLVTSTTARDVAGTTRTVLTGWDTDGIFPISETNALGHKVTRTWHDGLGVPLTQLDPNGLPTGYSWDGFGRSRGEDHPDGTRFQRDYGTRSLPEGAFPLVETTTASSGARSQVLRDALGREALRSTLGFGGAESFVRTTYDTLGRVSFVSRPYRSGQPQDTAERFEYDTLGRVRKEWRQNDLGKFIKRQYDKLKVDTWDEDGVHTQSEGDRAGHVIATRIYPAAGEATTRFAWGAFDTLLSTTDAHGNIVTMTYDKLGRRTQLVDEDTGTVSTVWNAFGETTSTTDARGLTTSAAFDALGRMTSRTGADGTDSWTWDTASGAGIGRVAQKSRGTIATSYGYDAAGRPASEQRSIDGATYGFDYSYDVHGRPQKMTYPAAPGRAARFAVSNVYDAFGNLSQVQSNGAQATVWTAQSTDAAGHVTQELLGNGMVTHRSYDETGRITEIQTPGIPYYPHQLKYTYSASGNVLSRKDIWLDRTESFTYDTVGRLASSTIPNGPQATYAYDALGNITAMTNSVAGVRAGDDHLPGCTWEYGTGTAGPHALTRITCPSFTYPFNYDASGNLLGDIGTGRYSEWTSFGKPREMSNPYGRQRFTYDADHVRTKKETVVLGPYGAPPYSDRSGIWGTTLHLGAYEQRSGGAMTGTDHVFYVNAGGRKVAQMMWRWNGTSGAEEWRYFHTDAQGTPERVTNAAGVNVEWASHSAFGTPRNYQWDGAGYPPTSETRIGYTGHQDDAEFGTVDMGGRIYDSVFKRFLSPDPIVQAPVYGPSWNRYSYVFNNPMRFTDPSGYEAIDFGAGDAGEAAFWSFFAAAMDGGGTMSTGLRSMARLTGDGKLAISLPGGRIIEATIKDGPAANLGATFGGGALSGAIASGGQLRLGEMMGTGASRRSLDRISKASGMAGELAGRMSASGSSRGLLALPDWMDLMPGGSVAFDIVPGFGVSCSVSSGAGGVSGGCSLAVGFSLGVGVGIQLGPVTIGIWPPGLTVAIPTGSVGDMVQRVMQEREIAASRGQAYWFHLVDRLQDAADIQQTYPGGDCPATCYIGHPSPVPEPYDPSPRVHPLGL
jgi:RHS repeat-associated protein